VTIKLGTEVVEIDCEKATLALEDGTRIQKDLLVIADGTTVS
jgi:2-polyprenyl-6-methoxyphenol hydroxylase-like FAD-dependent oxidoreductase